MVQHYDTGIIKMVKDAFTYVIEHIPYLGKRELYFHANETLFKAFQKFIQLLFISNGIYPIAYNKWIKEQIEGSELNVKAKLLNELLYKYC